MVTSHRVLSRFLATHVHGVLDKCLLARLLSGVLLVLYVRSHTHICGKKGEFSRCHPGEYHWEYHLCTLSLSEANLKGYWWSIFLNELQTWLLVHNRVHILEYYMETSSTGNIFRVIGRLWGDPPMASGAELWYFLWSAPEQTVGQIIETPSRSLWRHCNEQ